MTKLPEAITTFFLATAVGLSRFGCHYAEFSQIPGAKLLWFIFFVVLLLGTPAALIILLVSFARLIFRSSRTPINLIRFLAMVLCLWLFVWAADEEYELRRSAFAKLAEQSRPLVTAIQAYEKDLGHPPKLLVDLIPRYIRNVPKTGLSTAPDFHYHVIDPPDERGAWTLSIVEFAFRELSYWPSQNYGNKARYQVNDWGYFPG